jgi:hypothetical protein
MEPFLIFLVFAGTVALIVSPFLRKATGVWETSTIDTKLDRLNAVKDSQYKAIKDVDFEYAEGKLSEKDYNELRGYYKEKAILTIKEIEKLKITQPHPKAHEYEKHHGKGHHK